MLELKQKHISETRQSSDRTFGSVFAVFFTVIGLYPLAHGEEPRTWAIAIAGVLLGIAFAAPEKLGYVNRLWTRLGALLHAVTSPLALAVLFYFVVTPIGLLMRLFRQDPLRLRWDAAAESYWIRRDDGVIASETLDNQF